MPRIILHLDMDYFFAQVEERDHPAYKGKPIVVGADPKAGTGRGVVSTCSYEARKFGIHSGMPIAWAWRKCQGAIFLPVDYEKYAAASERIMAILRTFADKFEQVSIDEAFLEISEQVKRDYDKAKELALKIKKEVKEKEKLTCSVGIGPNKLIAKIASGFRKPDGLTVITPEHIKEFLAPLRVRELPGVGPKTEIHLRKLGIETIGQLAAYDINKLKQYFGENMGTALHEIALGIDESPVEERTEIKSMGRQVTFDADTKDKNLIYAVVEEITKDIEQQLTTAELSCKTVVVRIRYEDFATHTRQKALVDGTTSRQIIASVAKELLKEFLRDERKVRLVGVSVRVGE